jgi:glycosyltransferase involved in cell wall biosynthesis
MGTAAATTSIIVGIDASGIKSGGGLAHLVELVSAARPERAGISKVVVWAERSAAEALPQRHFLEVIQPREFNSGLINRALWQRRSLPALARAARCDVIFVPSGTSVSDCGPLVGLSQNMLPFQWEEARRYGPSRMLARIMLLRCTQGSLVRRADGYIFLTQFACDRIQKELGFGRDAVTIAHGVADRFRSAPRPATRIEDCGPTRPFRILYVSILDVYKHQWNLAEAVARLGRSGLPVQLDLVGPAYPPSARRLERTLQRVDPDRRWVRYVGPVPNAKLPGQYAQADLVAYASSCENLPIIMLEAMASGTPIACSDRGPMPEVLGPKGNYFNPESIDSIATCLETMVRDPALRDRAAADSYARSMPYTWERCADETFAYLADVARRSSGTR